MNVTQQLSNKIKLLREVHNFTQEYVASVLDISQNTYSLLEKGETKLTIDRLEKLAGLYKMDVVDMIQSAQQTYINTITNSQGVCSHHVTINHPLGDEERKMYQSTIDRLERENEKLHKLIERLTEKL